MLTIDDLLSMPDLTIAICEEQIAEFEITHKESRDEETKQICLNVIKILHDIMKERKAAITKPDDRSRKTLSEFVTEEELSWLK